MIPVPINDMRRLDLVVTELDTYRGLPLLCDVFCVSPITGVGRARGGCILQDGGAVKKAADRCHIVGYPEVNASGVARLCALEVEIFERWSEDALTIVKRMIMTRCANLPHRVQRDTQLRLLRR